MIINTFENPAAKLRLVLNDHEDDGWAVDTERNEVTKATPRQLVACLFTNAMGHFYRVECPEDDALWRPAERRLDSTTG